jgi:hypothetical protein
MTRIEQILALHEVRTVNEAALILRGLVAAELPDALPIIDAAIADARTASTPEEGLDRLGCTVLGLDQKAHCDGARGPLDDVGDALSVCVGLHGDCRAVEPCKAGRPTSCPREHGRALRRAAQEAEWSAVELRHDAGGACHYLDDHPVHNNARIELQFCEERVDADENLYWRPLPHGVRVVYVRRDMGTKIKAELLIHVAGYIFSHGLTDTMRFRWPTAPAGCAS